ncbi:MAG: cupin domain-containing protein [SAR324 cluster bacterium]|nr:cupin domain-containing protein [SAR324 cluster bacterium]
MSEDRKVKSAVIRAGASVLWENPPAHYSAFSKMLVRPENANTNKLDFRISSYQPMGYVEPHTHKIQEQIYHIQEGEGVMEIDGERHVVRAQDTVHIPPGIEHAIYNSGLVDLVFYVITSPPEDE